MRRYENKLNKMQVTIVVLFVVGLSSNIYSWNYRYKEGFGIGYADGSEDGYESGYVSGSEDGFETGYDEGESDGFNIGFDSGNETGYAHGKSDGYLEGYSVGETSGYSEGFALGRDEGLAEGYIEGNFDGYAGGSIDGFEIGYLDGYEVGQWDGFDTGLWEGYDAGLIDGAEKYAAGGYEGEYWFLRNPTEQEMWTFINADRTDRMTYVADKFTCVNFAATVKRNAFHAGYRCFSVYIFMADGGHDIVGFNTTDSGFMFIEPQHDRMMKVEVGIKYWDRKYYAPTYDDTILRYVLVP
jgi:flagellar biosynthesis/type III secretory pathway protein FliH